MLIRLLLLLWLALLLFWMLLLLLLLLCSGCGEAGPSAPKLDGEADFAE